MINEEIKLSKVRMFDENNNLIGIVSSDEARQYAYNHNLDLVLIAPQADPPVCRSLDYGKYKYEQGKRDKETKKKQQVVEVKEVQLSCRIDLHDFNTKINHARKFLEAGNKVRVCLRFKGREMAHQDLGRENMAKFADTLSDVSSVAKAPVLDGRQMTMFLVPIKN